MLRAPVRARAPMPDRLRTPDGIPFRPIFEAAGDAMLIVDDDHRVVTANPAATRLLRYPDGTLDGHPIATVAPAMEAPTARRGARSWPAVPARSRLSRRTVCRSS